MIPIAFFVLKCIERLAKLSQSGLDFAWQSKMATFGVGFGYFEGAFRHAATSTASGVLVFAY
jgi:hypothetical protein